MIWGLTESTDHQGDDDWSSGASGIGPGRHNGRLDVSRR